ncbi:MAG: ComF family protein [Clostridia bacterium]|nr:ComF family protein [Clostridia bacterium]
MWVTEAILGRIFPSKCTACGEIIGKYRGSNALCPNCREKWELNKRARCKICGMEVSDCLCGEGDMYLSGIRDHLKLVFYDGVGGVTGALIYSLKSGRKRSATQFIASECTHRLNEYLSSRDIDPASVLITYPPRTKKEHRSNGGDHSEIVSRAMAESLGCGFIRTLVRRGGVKQRELDFRERKINVENSIFPLDGVSLDGGRVVLVDDVVTSGATMSRAAVLLYRMGAEEVIALSVSRAKSHSTE